MFQPLTLLSYIIMQRNAAPTLIMLRDVPTQDVAAAENLLVNLSEPDFQILANLKEREGVLCLPIHACGCGWRAAEPVEICGCHREIIKLVSSPQIKKGGDALLKTVSSLCFLQALWQAWMDE